MVCDRMVERVKIRDAGEKRSVRENQRDIGVEEDNTEGVKRRREVRRQTKQGTVRERNRRGVGG